jgi:hypothetical protein
MKWMLFIAAVLLVLVCGCVTEEKTTTRASTTTTAPATATTLQDEVALDECASEADTLKRDNCYLLLAMNMGDGSLCALIERASARGLCNDNTQIETEGRSTTLQGYVINKTTSHVIPNVRVTAVSKTYGTIIGEDTTNEEGFYSITVPSRDTYDITLDLGGKTYSDEVYAKFGWTHEIWLKI